MKVSSYTPAIVSITFGFLCLSYPFIAVFFVSGFAFVFGLLYALVVWRVHKLRVGKYTSHASSSSRTNSSTPSSAPSDTRSPTWYSDENISTIENPSFRKVSTFIFSNGRWIKEETKTNNDNNQA